MVFFRLTRTRIEFDPAQVGVISSEITRRLVCYGLALVSAQRGLQGFRDAGGQFGLHRKDVGQVTIINFGPEMAFIRRANELHIDPHPITHPLHRALDQVRHPEFMGDFRQIRRPRLVALSRRARDHAQLADLRQPRDHFILHPVDEKGVLLVFAQIFKRENSDRLRQ